MRIGTSRADRLGFVVFAALASLLAVLVVTNLNNDPTESAQSVTTFADVAPPTAIPQTKVLSIPEPTPSPEPITIEPAAASVTDDEDETESDSDEQDDDNQDASTADGDAADEGTTDTSNPTDAQSANAEPAQAAPAASAVPNPQATTATAVPNPQPAASAVPNPQAAAATAVPNPQTASQPGTTAPVNVPADAPAGGTFTHTLSAKVSRPTLHTTPGGPAFTPTFNGTALPAVNPTVFGNTLVYRVIAGQPGDVWAKVFVPARPNGTTAWVQTSQFNWGSSNRMIQINVSNNTVTIFEGSNVLLTTAAVTGKSSSRTPLANGWVEEIMAGPSSAYGPRLLSLGIFSDSLNSFGGSIPKIALHGTNNPSLMGQYASNGCIRVPNDIINQIAGLMPVGSKVIITG
ncbi:MAG: L,D-transpeptidase family protein [Acidimicrobiaceae bacterium]|nr:L,D-transpeptidase family protein [bacterium]MCO4833748.1 L,D-transpeptidase family protein [Acidimicrobiaceae bacterium]